MDEMSPFCSACEMILAILSNLLCASSLMASCFSCFTVKVLEDFRVMTVAREGSRLVPLKAMLTGRPTPLPNAALEIHPMITVDVIRHVSTMSVIVLYLFIFLPIRSQTLTSSTKYASVLVNFFKRCVCGSCGAVGFISG